MRLDGLEVTPPTETAAASEAVLALSYPAVTHSPRRLMNGPNGDKLTKTAATIKPIVQIAYDINDSWSTY